MRCLPHLLVTLLLCAAIGDASAQIRQRSYERRSAEFSTSREDTASRLQQKRSAFSQEKRFEADVVEYQQWDKSFSRLGQKQAPKDFQQAEPASDRKRFRSPGRVDYPTTEFGRAGMDGQAANLRNIDQLKEMALVQKYRDANVVQVGDQSQLFSELAEEADLQQINRYQFRQNRPDGIPVQRAGQALQAETGSLAPASPSAGTAAASPGPRR